jgi:23S rRNA (cytosine1962-C5)-methyltransferase
LLAEVLPDEEAEPILRARCLRRAVQNGEKWEPAAPLRRPRARVAPGGAYFLEAACPYTLPELGTRATALLPNWPWSRGEVPNDGFHWEVEGRRGADSRVAFYSNDETALDALVLARWAESAGAPILGDLEHGGIACGGGIRLTDADGELQWPPKSVHLAAFPDEQAELWISAETAHVLRRGHPWVLPDSDTGDPTRFVPGSLVRLRVRDKEPIALARIEGERRLAARVWATGAEGEEDPRSIEARVVDAVRARAALTANSGHPSGTDAYRLVHGECDGLPGLAIDRLGPALRVVVSGPAALPIRDRAWRAALGAVALGTDAPVVEVLNLRHLPPGRAEAVRLIQGDWPEEEGSGPIVREGALRFRTDLGLGEAHRPHPGVGFFMDQRENRGRVGALVEAGGRYANLFAHTGAFSAALLAAGAGDVVSVDLSAPYLAWLEENLERSGLAGPAHQTIQRDVRQWLAEEKGPKRFDGIIVDPPTAASAGHRFFNAQREMDALLIDLIGRLDAGGFLLVSRNEQRGRKPLRAAVERASRDSGRALASCVVAPPGADFPRRSGFPEGTAFEGALAIFK